MVAALRCWGAAAWLLALAVHAAPGTRLAGGPGDDRLRDVAAIPGGGLVLAGQAEQSWVASLDPSGREAWRVTIPPAFGFRVGASASGDALIATTSDSALFVSRHGARGTSVWGAGVEVGESAIPDDVVEASDGSVWAAHRDSTGVQVTRFKPDGTLAWMRRAPLTSAHLAWPPQQVALAALGEGSVVVASNRRTTLARISPDGELLWQRAVVPAALRWLAVGASADRIVGVVTGSAGTRVLEMDFDGALIAAWEMPAVIAAAVAPDGSVGVLTVTPPGALVQGWIIARLEADRSRCEGTLWRGALPGSEWQGRATPDGRFVWAALREDGPHPGLGGRDIAIVEVDSSLRLPAGCRRDEPVSLAFQRCAMAADIWPVTWTVPSTVTFGGMSFARSVTGVTLAECMEDGCSADASESSRCGSARLDLASTSAQLDFCDDAEDRLDMTACAGALHVLSTSGLGPLADTVLELWSADCSVLLASDDDGGGSRSSRIAWPAQDDGIYRVVVRQKDGTTGPGRDYELRLDRPECPGAAWWVQSLQASGGSISGRDGALLEGGAVAIVGDTRGATVLVLGSDAVPQWGAVDAGEPASWRTVVAEPGGNMLLAGTCGSEAQPCFARVSSAGLSLERWALGGSDEGAAATGVVSDGVGGLLGWGELPVGRATRPFLLRINAAGAITWQCSFDMAASKLHAFPLADGGAIVALQGEQPWLARVDASGQLLWQRSPPPNQMQLVMAGILPDGASGTLLFVSSPRGLMAMLTVDGDGLVLGERAVSNASIARGFAPIPRGGAILHAQDPRGRGRLIKLSASGEAEWSRRTPALDASAPELLSAGADGILLSVRPGGIVRLDQFGRLGPSCDVFPPEQQAAPTPVAPIGLRAASVTFSSPQLSLIAAVHSLQSVPIGRALRCAMAECEPATVSISVTTPACEGSGVRLGSSGTGRGALTHEWDFDYDGIVFDVDATGSAMGMRLPAGPRVVAVRLTDSCPWGRQEAMATLGIDVLPFVPLIIEGPPRHCAGEPCVTLTASAGLESHLWEHGPTTASICVAPAVSTVYRLTATQLSGCVVTAEHSVAANGTRPLRVSITERCEGGLSRLTGWPEGGLPPLSFTWSSGGTDATALVSPGSHDVVVRDAAGCTAGARHDTATSCRTPAEVSGPGSPPLRLTGRDAGTVRFAATAEARGYNVLVGDLGAFRSVVPSATTCHREDWLDLGDGLLELPLSLPAGSWLLVTASNAGGEGNAGLRTDGRERSALPGWGGCGASR